jgi:hypothetical protein
MIHLNIQLHSLTLLLLRECSDTSLYFRRYLSRKNPESVLWHPNNMVLT